MAKSKKSADDVLTPAAASPPGKYVVLARKYRPATFDDLIGQEAMVRTLRNAFATGRIAQGYMLTGVRGVGKTTTARILARALNYETDTVHQATVDMPVMGRHCVDIIESRHADVIEMDAASNTGIDDIREIIESARYKPILARIKVFIIDEVHMLSKAAFNGLLKTLEEPPEHVKFIFATTEIRKVPVTVLSRCQRFDLRRVDVPALVQHFQKIATNEGSQADDDALAMIARAAEGSVRDGLSLLDQAIATGSGEGTRITGDAVRAMLGLADRGRIFDLLENLLSGTPAAALSGFAGLHRDGAEPQQVLSDLAETVHLVTRTKVAGPETGTEALSAEERRRAATLAGQLSLPLLSRAWQMLLKGIEETARAGDPTAAAEMVLIRIAYTSDLPAPDDLMRALGGSAVASRHSGAAPSAPAPASRTVINQLPAARQSAAPVAPLADTTLRSTETTLASDQEAFDQLVAQSATENFGDQVVEGPGDIEGLGDEDDTPAIPVTPVVLRPLITFADVVALVGERRDARLKVHLEDSVSLVKFDGATGAIDLHLLPGAPGEIANDLREKLNAWTGRRWMVALSKSSGERSIGDVRREREAAELAMLMAHPAVVAILAEFPGAKVSAVRDIDRVEIAAEPVKKASRDEANRR
jgi:DNA polymerase III subunit gamma/tau